MQKSLFHPRREEKPQGQEGKVHTSGTDDGNRSLEGDHQQTCRSWVSLQQIKYRSVRYIGFE